MTGMPTGEVEADPADGAGAGDTATAMGGSVVVGVGGSVASIGAGVSVRPPADGGEPGAASVMEPILGGDPVQALLRREDPRGVGEGGRYGCSRRPFASPFLAALPSTRSGQRLPSSAIPPTPNDSRLSSK